MVEGGIFLKEHISPKGCYILQHGLSEIVSQENYQTQSSWTFSNLVKCGSRTRKDNVTCCKPRSENIHDLLSPLPYSLWLVSLSILIRDICSKGNNVDWGEHMPTYRDIILLQVCEIVRKIADSYSGAI